jgi:hypothetical protein
MARTSIARSYSSRERKRASQEEHVVLSIFRIAFDLVKKTRKKD